jgi:hypothetical protein
MITPVGSVIDVQLITGGIHKAQVTSAGPRSVPASVWAVTSLGGRRFILVKRNPDLTVTPRYFEVSH